MQDEAAAEGHYLTPHRPIADTSKLFALITAVVVVAALYFARAVLVPFALAILFSFLLAPLVRQLERVRLPRVPAVLVAVIFSLAFAASVAAGVTNQLLDVASQLPNYRAHIESKLAYLHNGGIGVMKVTDRVSELGEEMADSLSEKARNGGHRSVPAQLSSEPIPVQIVKPVMTSWESLASLLSPLGVAVVIFVFTVFILLRFEDLRNRFIRLVGHNHLTLMTQALDDASQRIARYLLLQFLVNASYGLVIGTGLYLIGLPNALLWGTIAAVSRFIPYLGPPVGAFFPIALSLAVFDGWSRSFEVAGFFLSLEIIVANIVEPLLYGANIGVSSLAILVAAVFWTLLWGPIGLVLSTPLTVCLVVVGRHVPQLEFLHILLGDEPVLTPESHFYQRMLASELGDARRVLSQNLEGKTLQDLYDSVVIPALSMAQRDRRQDGIDDSTADFIWRSTRELANELYEEYNDSEDVSRDEMLPAFDTRNLIASDSMKVACIPGRSAGDETVGVMLVHLLELRGVQAYCLSLTAQSEMIEQLLAEEPDIVVISALQPFGATHARKLYTLIKTRLPRISILLGLWSFSGDLEGILKRLGPEMSGLIVTDLAGALQRLQALGEEPPSTKRSEAGALR